MASETQHDMTLLEGLLRVANSCLSHKRLFVLTIFIPVLVTFILVMWVIKPSYAAEAIVTPPASGSPLTGSLGKLLLLKLTWIGLTFRSLIKTWNTILGWNI